VQSFEEAGFLYRPVRNEAEEIALRDSIYRDPNFKGIYLLNSCYGLGGTTYSNDRPM